MIITLTPQFIKNIACQTKKKTLEKLVHFPSLAVFVLLENVQLITKNTQF